VIPELIEPTAVVCHDAGAANIIQAWILAKPKHDWRPVMDGPAARSWDSLRMIIPTFRSLESALSGASLVLTGTGWSSDLEHLARRLARTRGIPTVAVLDHWINYEDRFTRNGEVVLPDAIYVTDKYALREACLRFPSVPVSLYENLYLAAQLSELPPLEANADEVLYLLEPIRADWPRHLPGELEALEYFFKNWDKLNIPAGATLRLRPHPSDPPGKYAEWLDCYSVSHRHVVLDHSRSLVQDMKRARWIVGCETYAMVVALAAGREVISSLPPWAPPCRLPHEGIIHMSRLNLN